MFIKQNIVGVIMKLISIPQLGVLLLQARKDKGLKQKDVLKLADISRTTLYELENGLREHIDLASVFKLLALYDLSLDVSPRQLTQRLHNREQLRKELSSRNSAISQEKKLSADE